MYSCLCVLDLDRLLASDEDVDFDENASSVLGANTGNARLESGASSRRGCANHGYNYYLIALSTFINLLYYYKINTFHMNYLSLSLSLKVSGHILKFLCPISVHIYMSTPYI